MNSSNNKEGESLLSLSGSLDLDSYEIEDEVAIDATINQKNSSRHNSIPPEVVDEEDNCVESGSGSGGAIGDSLDLDNSDDLNKIIQKYENMLGGNNNDNKK